MAKLILGKGPIAFQRGRDAADEPTVFIIANLGPKLELAKGTNLGVPMEEKDLKFEVTELSPEGQKSVLTLIAEIETRIKAAARPRAQKLADDAGLDLEA